MTGYENLTHPIALVGFGLTLILPVFVGFLTYQRMKNESDFFLGGRTMDRIVVALSAVSSGRSSWLVLGVSGMAYARGVGAVWAILGYSMVELVQFLTIGYRLRKETEKSSSITVLDYFESRFQDRTNLVRGIGALIIGIFLTAYVSAQLNAGAKSLTTTLNIPLLASLFFCTILILIYMILGGFIAVVYNDVLRAVIMIFGLCILPCIGFVHIDGFKTLLQILKSLDPKSIDIFSIGAGGILGFLGIGLGSPGQPHILVRYMAIDDPKKLKTSAFIGTFWNLTMGLGAVMIGLLGRAVIPNVQQLPNHDPEMTYLALSSQYLGALLYGILVGGIFAAILSTVDSQLLVVASTAVRDCYEKIWRKDRPLTEREKLRLSRWVVFFSGLMSIVLAYFAKEIIFWLVLFAWGGLGASIGPALIFSLYWNPTTKYGVIAGMITGTLITFIWRLWLKPVTGLYELIPAFFFSCMAIVGVSLFTRNKGDQNAH